MKEIISKYRYEIAFIYNFHAWGPLYIWPYNAEKNNPVKTEYPEAFAIYIEIANQAKFPKKTLKGNAYHTVGYTADGESSDYIMKEFGIPTVSSELANDDYNSNDFMLKSDNVVRSVLRDNYPWILHTF
jgi:hypothetical protein